MTTTNRFLAAMLLCAAPYASAAESVTLERCAELTRENYPMVRQYRLVEQTAAVSLSDINRGWLPRVGVYAQATAQNAVPAFPDALGDVLDSMGQRVDGLSRLQWKAGIDLSQTVWDGGAAKAARRIERARTTQAEAAIDVEMHAAVKRVEDLYFGALLLREQLSRNQATIALLESNHRKLLSMEANGTATRSDAEMVEARILSLRQQQTEARGALDSYLRMLGIYTGLRIDDGDLEKPSLELPADLTPDRPEQRLLDARGQVNDATKASIAASVMPRVGFFAQGYYGYPGFDYFKSMMSRDASFNLLAGIKVSWNMDSFYTKRNNERRVALANESIDTERQTFLFNNRLQREAEMARIESLREVMEDDRRIIELRQSVRRAAESRLANGVIDTDALLANITDENQARLSASYHEIQMLQYISNLKHILNR